MRAAIWSAVAALAGGGALIWLGLGSGELSGTGEAGLFLVAAGLAGLVVSGMFWLAGNRPRSRPRPRIRHR